MEQDFIKNNNRVVNYYELYKFVMAIQGYREALTYFSVEDNYMDGLDADSWY